MTETVLITGAAGRLGKLIAERLASEGCFVWIHYRSHESEAILLRDQIKENGGQAECVQADLTDMEERELLSKEHLDHIGEEPSRKRTDSDIKDQDSRV